MGSTQLKGATQKENKMDNISKSILLEDINKEMSKRNLPVVFKGATVLRIMLENNNPCEITRWTNDIDIDWVGTPLSMKEFESLLNKVIEAVNGSLYVKAVRDYEERRAAGFDIINGYREEVVAKIDLSVKKNNFYAVYRTYDGISFYGASIYKMIADKCCGISNKTVYRRTKDLIDLYLLSYIAPEKYVSMTYQVLRSKEYDSTLGTFEDFKEGKEKIRKTFEKSKCTEKELDFEEVYSRVEEFTKPFWGMRI